MTSITATSMIARTAIPAADAELDIPPVLLVTLSTP